MSLILWLLGVIPFWVFLLLILSADNGGKQ